MTFEPTQIFRPIVPERMYWTLISVLFFVGMSLRVGTAEEAPSRFNRAQSVINAFQVMCTLDLPEFDRIAEKATLMQMQLQSDNSGPSAGDTVTRQKSWIGILTDGPFFLLLDEMSGAKGRSTACAIAADIPDRDGFRAEAIRAMKLPDAPAPELRGDGSRSYFWDGVLGPGTTILERDFAPSGKPGVMLKLLSKVPPAR
jgi:hypothetical protein